MKITEGQLADTLVAFATLRIRVVVELAHEGMSDGIGVAWLLAAGSRESYLRDVAGDRDRDHGHGWPQLGGRASHVATGARRLRRGIAEIAPQLRVRARTCADANGAAPRPSHSGSR